jgi:5-methylcytosine-specific restriction endonuclease McrA
MQMQATVRPDTVEELEQKVAYAEQVKLIINRIHSAKDIDHIEPRKANPARSFDITNLQALCKACHTKKTIKESMLRRRRQARGGG